jgi:EmrB/QacA subfamily drug resistance transporter
MRRTNRPLTVAALMLALAMAAMEMTVVSTAMPTAIGELGGLGKYAWVFAAYMLASTVMVPIYGKIADLYGRKPVMLVGIVIFLVGSMASGQARTMDQLIAFRALQGLGAGAMQPIAFTIVGDIFTLDERARMQGVFGAVWGLAGLLGPLLGGVIVKVLSWRWVFYINVPFGIAAMLVLSYSLVESIEKKRHRLDVMGALLLALSIIALLLGAQGTLAVVLLPLSAVLAFGFVMVERTASEPILPLDLFQSRAVSVASIASAMMGAAMVATVTFVPLFVQGLLGGSATDAGAAIAPMVIGWPIASALSGRLLPRVGFRPLIVLGMFVTMTAAVALALLAKPGVDRWTLRLVAASFGVGMGFSNTALLIAVQTTVRWERRGVATASTVFFRTIGATIGVGVLGALLASALSRRAAGSAAIVNQLLAHQKPAESQLALLRSLAEALQSALTGIFWAIAVMAVVAFVVSLFFPRLSTEEARATTIAPAKSAEPTGEIAQ